jgi:alkylation response protein AidB-like acyl-CoA dehydrogenase
MAMVTAGGNGVGTLPQATRRDFSDVDYDEAMRRARAIVPTLRERAQPSEDARGLLRDNEQLLHETGLFRFHQPKAFGGMELKLRFRAHSAFAVNQAREAVETLWSCYGANGIYTRDPLQRYLRDVLAISQHFSFNFDIAGSAYGLVALGGSFASPTM